VTYILYTIDRKKSIELMFRTHFRMYNLFTQFNSFFVYFCHFPNISNNAEYPSLFYVNNNTAHQAAVLAVLMYRINSLNSH
jgi:hypothetical protein